jgi:phenylacetate-CoA ligase
MAQTAAAEGIDIAASAVRALIVAGEPGGNIPATRERIETAWNARVFDHVGMTETGPWGFECADAPGGVHVIETAFIAEVIDPKTEAICPEGQPGELVLSNLGRLGSPLIRYRTGDQVALVRDRCACGRSFARIEGGLVGRLDDMLIIRGNNVFPAAVEGVLRDLDGIEEFRLHVEQREAMDDLRIEVEPAAGAATAELAGKIVKEVRDRLHFTPRVAIAAAGTLPRFEMKARRVVREPETS